MANTKTKGCLKFFRKSIRPRKAIKPRITAIVSRKIKLLKGLPVGDHRGDLRKAMGKFLDNRSDAQRIVKPDSTPEDRSRALKTPSRSFLERTKLIPAIKKAKRDKMVVVKPGSVNASQRLGVLRKVDKTQVVVTKSNGSPRGLLTVRTVLLVIKLATSKPNNIKEETTKRACLLNS